MIKLQLFENEINLNRIIQKKAGLFSLGVFRSYFISLNDGRRICVLELERAAQTLKEIFIERIKQKKPFTDSEKNQFYSDLIKYLSFLHGEHGDIKPNNIFFLDIEKKYILGDFGISQKFENLNKILINIQKLSK